MGRVVEGLITSSSGESTRIAQDERSRRLRLLIQANPNPNAGESTKPQSLQERLLKTYKKEKTTPEQPDLHIIFQRNFNKRNR